MRALAVVSSRSRRGCRRGLGALVGLVLFLGALDLHDPGLTPAIYATPTPVRPGTECDGGCQHIEVGSLLTPDHLPATQPGGKLRLPISRICEPAAPEAVDWQVLPGTPTVPGPPAWGPHATRAPPVA